MDSAKNGRWIIPFKKFSKLRVNIYCYNASGIIIMNTVYKIIY